MVTLNQHSNKPEWGVYFVLCSDNSIYAGITNKIARRITEHNSSPKGAKYTRARRPVKLVYWEAVNNRSQACKREAALKKLSRTAKLALIDQYNHSQPR